MGASREAWVYSNPGHPFDRMPLDIFQEVGPSGAGGMIKYFNHFLQYHGPAAEGTTNGWILSGVTGAATIVTVPTDPDGIIQLSSSATAGGNAHLELENVELIYEVGKQMWVFTRMSIEDADDQIIYFGLGTTGTTDWVAALPADGIFFEKAETATDFDFHVRKDGTSTENTADFGATLADTTYFTIGFKIDAIGTITPYLSVDSESPTAGTGVLSSDANVPDAAADVMTVQYFTETGASAADYINIDWLMVVKER